MKKQIKMTVRAIACALCAVLCLSAFAGCAQKKENTASLRDTPITVNAMVGEYAARAGYDYQNLPEKFYLTVTQEMGVENSPYNYTDVEMTKGDGSSYTEPDGVQMLWKDETPSAITAYTIATGTEVSVMTDQSTSDNLAASDLLGAVYTTDNNSGITITGSDIGISFRHLLCKLNITLSWGTELDNATTKEITGVIISGLNTTATLDRSTAAITDGATVADINAYTEALYDGAIYTAEAIFVPSDANPAITIFAKIDGVERVFSITPTAPEGGFKSGNCYTVNITVGGSVVYGINVSVNGWENGGSGSMATN